jgi:extradiol dioxygenase
VTIAVRGLGYLELVSMRVDAWSHFAVDVLGAEQVSRPGAEVHRFAFDDVGHRLGVRAGDEEAVLAVGWEVASSGELDALHRDLCRRGFDARRGTDNECVDRGVAALVRVVDDGGFAHELFAGQQYRRDSFRSHIVRGGFVTGRRGFGHVVFTVPDVDASVALFVDALGFRPTEIVPVPHLGTSAVFLRCNPRHHSIAVMGGDEPRLHHLMVQLRELDDVGRAHDRVEAAGHELMYTLGRHHGDGMLSFYVATPSDFAIEYGWGAFDVDDEWVVRTPTPGEVWGHKRLAPIVGDPPFRPRALDSTRTYT